MSCFLFVLSCFVYICLVVATAAKATQVVELLVGKNAVMEASHRWTAKLAHSLTTPYPTDLTIFICSVTHPHTG